MSDDYEVGYGKPPKSGQFKPGHSGNPKGKPKGAKNLKTELEEELHEMIAIKEGGKQKKVSKQKAMLKSMMAKAVQGDAKAANLIIGMVYRLLNDQSEEPNLDELSAEDRRILDAYEARLFETFKKKGKTNDPQKT